MVKLNKIYTRTGDKGDTGLGDGRRVRKYDLRVAAYGTVDEANAAIGVAIAALVARGVGLCVMTVRSQIEDAVAAILDKKIMTRDIATPGVTPVSTSAMGGGRLWSHTPRVDFHRMVPATPLIK